MGTAVGAIGLVVGTVDPLEGAVLILAGIALIALADFFIGSWMGGLGGPGIPCGGWCPWWGPTLSAGCWGLWEPSA